MKGWPYRQHRCEVKGCGLPVYRTNKAGLEVCVRHYNQPAPEGRVFDKPRIVTFDDLQATLLPIIQEYPWAMDTLRDLWLMGAPDPSPRPINSPEKRILNPGQFANWWADVVERMGLPLTPNEIIRG